MPIRLEYIVTNSRGVELKRFDLKTEAEAYDSVICAAEDLIMLIKPVQKKLSLSDEQIDGVAEHLAFRADDVKNALKQIKKLRPAPAPETAPEHGQDIPQTKATPVKKHARKKAES